VTLVGPFKADLYKSPEGKEADCNGEEAAMTDETVRLEGLQQRKAWLQASAIEAGCMLPVRPKSEVADTHKKLCTLVCVILGTLLEAWQLHKRKPT